MKKKIFIKLLSFVIVVTFFMPLSVKANFNDLSDIKGHWAEEDIRVLVEKGIISGYPDGSFKPNKSITRAEFVKLVVKTFDLKSYDSSALEKLLYEDTFNSEWHHWALEYINIATTRGIIQGTGKGKFSPNEPLTREQMAVIIHKLIYEDTPIELLGLSNIHIAYSPELIFNVKDFNQISSWAQGEVIQTILLGIMRGYGTKTFYFKPRNEATRAEVVTVLVRLLTHPKNYEINVNTIL